MSIITVSKDSDGDFQLLQDAILSINDQHTEQVCILVKPGVYEEKVWIRKTNIKIIGEDRDTTIFRYGDGARKPRNDGTEYGTFNTAVILLAGSDITLENITIENTAGPGSIAGQALALFTASDRTFFKNCCFLGYQDTIFTADSEALTIPRLMLPDFFTSSTVPIEHSITRSYFDACHIAGDVDFIFGPGTAFFNHCDIVSLKRVSEAASFITAASTPMNQEFGYVFRSCHLIGLPSDQVYLGRPWRDYAKTAFIECELDAHIVPEGWHNWGRPKAEITTSYVELNNTGAGANIGQQSDHSKQRVTFSKQCVAFSKQRVAFSKQLCNQKLLDYFTVETVLRGEDDWII